MMYPQFALELSLNDEPRLENLIVGRNVEVLRHLHDLIADRFEPMALYLWGAGGAGKTHILRSLAVSDRARYLTAADFERQVEPGDYRWFLVDDVDGFSAQQQTHLFHLFNAVRSEKTMPLHENRHMVLTASCSPAHLPIDFLPDLRTRLAWDLVYELYILSDEEKAQVLFEQAEQRGLTLGHGVIDYMLRYSSRDLSKLHEFLVQLDRYGLQKKQAITVPLLKEWLNADAHETSAVDPSVANQ